MNITIIGTGYVGLVAAACLSTTCGHDVLCYDIDKKKIADLKQCKPPIYEDELEERLILGVEELGTLNFTDDPMEAVCHASIIFVCVGTPSREDGTVNLDYVEAVCETIRLYQADNKIVIMKSTVPVGTHKKLKEWLPACEIISNPEFLREGVAISDFEKPDRIVIGMKPDREVEMILQNMYHGGYDGGIKGPIWIMDNASAEMVKYVSNAMLANRVAFMNEVAELCDKTGAKIGSVRLGVGDDTRIGPKFLEAGPGYGGSCFPKDTRGLRDLFRKHGLEGKIVNAVIESNEDHKEYMMMKLEDDGVQFEGKKVVILGLAFKPETDDTRESPTIRLIEMLKRQGAVVVVHDPVAQGYGAQHRLGDALYNADIVFVMTEWDCYKGLTEWNLKELICNPIKKPDGVVIADCRNIWNRERLESIGFRYYGMGN